VIALLAPSVIDNFFDAEDLPLAFLVLGVTGSAATGESSVASGSIAIGASAAIDSFEAAMRAIGSLAVSMIGSDSGGILFCFLHYFYSCFGK
jgi:hypothetical protein